MAEDAEHARTERGQQLPAEGGASECDGTGGRLARETARVIRRASVAERPLALAAVVGTADLYHYHTHARRRGREVCQLPSSVGELERWSARAHTY